MDAGDASHKLALLQILTTNNNVPPWVIDSYVCRFSKTRPRALAEFQRYRNDLLSILNQPVTKSGNALSKLMIAQQDKLILRLLREPISSSNIVALETAYAHTGIPPYFRDLAWGYLLEDSIYEAEAIANSILSSKEMDIDYAKYPRENEDTIIPLHDVLTDHLRVWAKGYVLSNRILLDDIRRTFSAVGFFNEGTPLFAALCDVLVATVYRHRRYIQGMTYLCGIPLLFSDGVSRAISITLRVSTSRTYQSFLYMHKEAISTWGSFLFKALRQLIVDDIVTTAIRCHITQGVSQLFLDSHDAIFDLMPASLASLALTLFGKLSLDLALFAIDAFSFAPVDEKLFILFLTFYIMRLNTVASAPGESDLIVARLTKHCPLTDTQVATFKDIYFAVQAIFYRSQSVHEQYNMALVVLSGINVQNESGAFTDVN